MCTSASQMGIACSWIVDWGAEMGWMRWNHSIAKTIKRVANPRLEFGWSVSWALRCSTSAESDGNERRSGGEKREIGVLEFYKL